MCSPPYIHMWDIRIICGLPRMCICGQHYPPSFFAPFMYFHI